MSMPKSKPRRAAKKKSAPRRRRQARRPAAMIGDRIVTNTGAIRENYTTLLTDGLLTYFSVSLANPTFDRAQSMAKNFQEYRVKYVKVTFRPSADTFPLAAGNTIPQLYFQMNKYQAFPAGGTLQNLIDMGCRPVRFDDKNVVRAWKPVVLLGTDSTGVGGNPAAAVKVTPWLSTNAFATDPTNWNPSDVEHLGAVWEVTKVNPSTPAVQYYVDVEVVFQFRRPLSQPSESSPYQVLKGDQVTLVLPSAQ